MTYLFVHSPTQLSHILFNMLAVWMFGVDLERRWGTRGFVKYYFITGVGAGVSMILVSLLPFAATRATFDAVTIGASGRRLRSPDGVGRCSSRTGRSCSC